MDDPETERRAPSFIKVDGNSGIEEEDQSCFKHLQMKSWLERHNKLVKLIIKLILLGLFSGYFIWATVYYKNNSYESLDSCMCTGYGFLMLMYIFIVFGIIYVYAIKPFYKSVIRKSVCLPIQNIVGGNVKIKIIFYLLILAAIVAYLIYDTRDNRNRLIAISGLVFFVAMGYLFSTNKSKINWDTVLWGLILQFGIGLLTIRWATGREIFNCLGAKITTFLNYANDGAAFVYGDLLVNKEMVFAFRPLAAIFFLGFFINILYYYGIMQNIVIFVAKILQSFMNTSICESVICAANIFIGMSESPFLIKPYLKDLTDSEIHSIMTSGFATVAGSILAAYIAFGASASSLIIASVMSAPAALCYSKLVFPETEEIKLTKKNVKNADVEYDSVLDAAARGANDAFYVVSGIIASVIAFISMIHFLNGIIGWMGMLVGFTDPENIWTFELIVGKIFTPIAFIMGVEWDDCEKVGQLIGIKTIVNELVAFERMQKLGLVGRSKTIATFAISGFSNPGSVGITISTFSTLIPNKRDSVMKYVLRAFTAGAVVCFMTACIAAILMPDESIN